MALLARGVEMVPAAHVAETLGAEFERLVPAILGLPLITKVGPVTVDRAGNVREQRIEIELNQVEFGLEQRAEAEFVTLVPLVRQLELQDESDIDGIFAGVGELELVFPFDRIETAVRAFALALDVELGEPPCRRAVANAQTRRLLRRLVRLGRCTVFEVDLALAVGDAGQEDVIGRARRCVAGGNGARRREITAV